MDRSSSPINTHKKTIRVFSVLIPIAFLTIFFYFPFGFILWESTVVDFDPLLGLLHDRVFFKILWFTLWQAAASTALTLVISLPVCYLLARCKFPGRNILQTVLTVPFVLPTVVVGTAFVALFERFGFNEGSIRINHTIWAVLLAHIFFNIAVAVRTVTPIWSTLDQRIEDQARILGSGPWQTFRWVTFPHLAPAIISAGSLIFLFCLTSFSVILILGGPAIVTLETEIFRHAIWRGELSIATALATIQLLIVVSAVSTANRLQRRLVINTSSTLPILPKPKLGILLINLIAVSVLVFLPIATLIESSFSTKDGYSFRNYQSLFDRTYLLPLTSMEALGNSLKFAVISALIALLVGGLASLVITYEQKWLANFFDLGTTLPLGASAVTVGFGILIALNQPPFDFHSSQWLIPIVHALIGLPFVVRNLVPALRSIDNKLREAASILGANPTAIRREVDLPIVHKSLIAALGFAFAISIGEFGATSFLPRSPDHTTAPLILFRLLGNPGDLLHGQAMALAVVLMLLTAVGLVMINGRETRVRRYR